LYIGDEKIRMKQYYRLFCGIHPVVVYLSILTQISPPTKSNFINFVNRSSMFLSCVFKAMNFNAWGQSTRPKDTASIDEINAVCCGWRWHLSQCFFPVALRTDSRSWPPLTGFRDHIQLETPHSIGLLWTSDQPDAETSTWQYTTITRDRLSFPGRDSNPQSQQVINLCQYYRHVVHWPSIVCTVCNEGVNC